jgi:hypothetical protein
MLGAYFSPQGDTIHQGASGLGAVSSLGLPLYVDGEAYDKPLQLSHDPNEPGHPVHLNGRLIRGPITIEHRIPGRATRAFRDGSLGTLSPYRNGSLGTLSAYRDGSLGSLRAYRDGSLGDDEPVAFGFTKQQLLIGGAAALVLAIGGYFIAKK